MNYTIEDFDSMKTKVLKYVLYKKRTEQEVRTKFIKEDENLIDDVIEYLKEAGYISDLDYVSRSVNEFIALKNLSLKEIKYKLLSKGINKSIIEDYFSEHSDELKEYEENSLSKVINKKENTMEREELIAYLLKKGYNIDDINKRFNER